MTFNERSLLRLIYNKGDARIQLDCLFSQISGERELIVESIIAHAHDIQRTKPAGAHKATLFTDDFVRALEGC